MVPQPVSSPAPAAHRSRRSLLTIELLVLSALAATWLLSRSDAPPAVHWQFGETRSAAEPFSSFPPGFPLRLAVDLPRPMYVYVASHDMLRGNIALWPSAALKSELEAEPIAAGSHFLPGSFKGQDVQWHVGDGVGATTFLVIVSEQPLPDLAAAMTHFRQMGNAAFPDRSTCTTYAPPGGMKDVPARSQIAHPLLQRCASDTDGIHDGAMQPVPGVPGAWMKSMHVITPIPEGTLDQDGVRRELEARFGGLKDMLGTQVEGGSETQGPQSPSTPPAGGR